jgi:hypothetical protein
MFTLRSAVLNPITLSAPWTHRAVLHPHARTATGRVRLTPSRHLSLSPRVRCGCTTRVEGGGALCMLTYPLGSWCGVEGGHAHACAVTREGSRERRIDAHTPRSTAPPCSCTALHVPSPTFQLHSGGREGRECARNDCRALRMCACHGLEQGGRAERRYCKP